jgi:tetratricopeptide (TPR) repeat protein
LEEAQFHLTGARDILTQSSDWFGLAAGVYHAEGVLAAAEERWDEAGAAFERAADTNEQHGLLYDQAQALYEWAAMYLDRNETGDRERGSELLDKALDIFQRCDARKDVEKVIARKEFLGGVIARFSRLYAGVTL